MRPRIAISCGVYGDERRLKASVTYAESVWAVGGMPLYAPAAFDHPEWASSIVDVADGVVFTGGGDVEPLIYGGRAEAPLEQVVRLRDDVELDVMRETAARGLPILAICRGCQLMNVAFGGTLYQDLPSQRPTDIAHSVAKGEYPEDQVAHDVRLAPGSRIAEAHQAEVLGVNSMHHQGIDAVAKSLVPVAFGTDGLVEAIESQDGWLVGVQWHPERMVKRHPEHLALFTGFINAARTRHGTLSEAPMGSAR